MKYLTLSSTDPHLNMAFDQYCLEQLQAEEPVFYLWQNRPSVIIGLSQSAYAEVNLKYLEENGIILARRVTGGGAVYHDLGNLNYSITGRIRDLERDFPAYVHTMADALRSLGLPVELSGRNDILLEGRKCSGYAKRMSRDRLMIHGTLMYDVDLDSLTRALTVPGSKLSAAGVASVHSRVVNLKGYLPQFRDIRAFRDALQGILSDGDGEIVLTEGQLSAVKAMADGKFRTWQWNYGHSPAADFRVSRKFPCGTVEAAFSIKGGRITGLRFCGDFLGADPPDTIERGLEGCRYAREEIHETMDALPVSHCFDGVSASDLAELLLQA